MSPDATPPRAGDPTVIVALHLPDLAVAQDTSLAFLEDFVLANMAVFAEAGVPSVMLQDQTRTVGPAAPATVAIMSSLGRLVRRTFPSIDLGIIVQAHDAEAPLAIAHAVGASFVRLKVFVGGVMSMEGPKIGLAVAARAYRHALRRDDLQILADVFDRTSVPTIAVPPEEAAVAAVKLGADALILTGGSLAESIDRVRRAKASGVRKPILVGGGVSQATLAETLGVAEGVVVSSALMRTDAGRDLLQWDADKTRGFMDEVRRIATRRAG